jgi:integrative and conjugative element protein (TIGR02256 family)
MLSPFSSCETKIIAVSKLKIAKARELAAFLQRPMPFVRLIRCERLKNTNLEAVVFDVEVEVGQRKQHDIREIEPIGVVFDPEDKLPPEVLALREDFPVTPHQNSRLVAPPRWLCLYEEPYSEQKLRWSALSFVERIREWLRLSAVGTLHGEDQPLEQLLSGASATIILPHDFEKQFSNDNPVFVTCELFKGTTEKPVLRLATKVNDGGEQKRIIPVVFTTRALQHGVIDRQPENLWALHEFCQKAKFDLLGALASRLRYWIHNKSGGDIHNDRLALILIFPKTRRANSTVEVSDVWVFFLEGLVQQVTLALGVEAKEAGITTLAVNFGTVQNIIDESLVKGIKISPLWPVYTLSRENAAFFNGFKSASDKRILAVGMGAIGSQIFNNLVRSGFGKWTLVDKDILLPHNCARHALFGNCIGFNKVDGLAALANFSFEESDVATGIVADIFDPGNQRDALDKTFADADIVLDFSASPAVCRHLGYITNIKARRASVFLNPTGTDSVVLVEDAPRKHPLAWLEMAYYRRLAIEDKLDGHLTNNEGSIRYARSCGDVSSRMNQNLVALHSAICAQILRDSLEQDGALITIFRADPRNFTVQRFSFETPQFRMQKLLDWDLFVSQDLLDKARKLRQTSLPNETGGVLIGQFDRQRRIIFAVDMIPSPADSREWPTLYIRGVRGLRSELKRFANVTAGNLDYIGEWHSHPAACSPELSNIDRQALRTLSEEMSSAGLPALMLIVAERNREKWFLG